MPWGDETRMELDGVLESVLHFASSDLGLLGECFACSMADDDGCC